MKHFKSLATLFVAAGALSLASCNSGDKKAEESKTDTTSAETTTAVTTTSGPNSVMLVRHKVTDYAKWKPSYDSHDAMRLASGLHNYVIARGTEDSNMVMVALKMDDVEKAKALNAGMTNRKNKTLTIGWVKQRCSTQKI